MTDGPFPIVRTWSDELPTAIRDSLGSNPRSA
jgi:hypothetical protein